MRLLWLLTLPSTSPSAARGGFLFLCRQYPGVLNNLLVEEFAVMRLPALLNLEPCLGRLRKTSAVRGRMPL